VTVNRFSELHEFLERLEAAREAGVRWTKAERSRLVEELTVLIADCFPDVVDRARAIAETVVGKRGAEEPSFAALLTHLEAVEASPEEVIVSGEGGYDDGDDGEVDGLDPLSSRYLKRSEVAPDSYLVFALLSLLRATVFGIDSLWEYRDGDLLPVKGILAEVTGATATVDAVKELAHRYRDTVLARDVVNEQLLRDFFAVPGSLTLLDAVAVVYGDVVCGANRSRIGYPVTPVPDDVTPSLLWRLRVAYRLLGSSRLTAKAFRMRKQRVLELLKESQKEER